MFENHCRYDVITILLLQLSGYIHIPSLDRCSEVISIFICLLIFFFGVLCPIEYLCVGYIMMGS